MSEFEIIKIDAALPESLAGQGYEVLYWHVSETVFDAPIDPFTQSYWLKKNNSTLVHGLFLPALDMNDGGDLVILVVQSRVKAQNAKFGNLSVRQRFELYKFITQMNFSHGEGMRIMPFGLQVAFYEGFEKTFAEEIMPLVDEHGRYYKRQRPKDEDFDFPTLDKNGGLPCPTCERVITIEKDLIPKQSFLIEDGTILVFGVCEHCKGDAMFLFVRPAKKKAP